MLVLILLVAMFIVGLALLFGDIDQGPVIRFVGFMLIVGGVCAIVFLCMFSSPRVCQSVWTVEPLYWDNSPFKANVNYVGLMHEGGGGSSYDYINVKIRDEYGSPKMLRIDLDHVAFLGTGNDDVNILRYDITFWGRLTSLSWSSRYVMSASEGLVRSGEDALSMKSARIYYVGGKGISPDLRRWLGTNDGDTKLMGLAEVPPEAKR